MKSKGTVFVGLSGGVDSSVAALRLKNEGYHVVGVFIKVWHPDFLVCNWEEERLDAMRVAAHLDIPFLTCDAEDAYKKDVADYFIAEYKAGRTPNPDVMCNKAVKFGRFLEFAKSNRADYIATGHYAQKNEQEGTPKLERGIDVNKDQTYFLWTLNSAQLSMALLPIGRSQKSAIREEALRARIPVAKKKDSQGVCFLGHIDIPEFLSHYIELKEGAVLDTAGATIGKHNGAFCYTLGQRHGFSITNSNTQRTPYYVVQRNIENNTITVSETPPHTTKSTAIELSSCNFIGEIPKDGDVLEAQFRYRQKPFQVQIALRDEHVTVTPLESVEQPAVGQSCVLYDGSVCLGGGIIAG